MLPQLSSKKAVKAGALCSVLTGFIACLNAQASEIAAVGAIEDIDCARKVVRVLGTDFVATNAATAASICSLRTPSGLVYAAIVGRVQSPSEIELLRFSVLSEGEYVPGASSVYVRGTISATNLLTGEIAIGGAVVMGASEISQGAVEILGTQPLLGGKIFPTKVTVQESESSDTYRTDIHALMPSSTARSAIPRSAGMAVRELLSSAGFGKASSAGSGKLSSAGSGKLSSAGSGKASSAGSGRLSSAGSGKLSSAGSGKVSSAGSGKLSSAGSGKLSSAGSGKLSSAGSGKVSSAGSGKLSSAGSGKLSSAGSGRISSAGSGAAYQ